MTTRSPFDDRDGDIIFRSSDGNDFRLYKNIIAKASPIFRGMLTLPNEANAPDGPQTVSLTEDAETLEGLLRLCYPVERPRFDDFDRLRAVLEAARKYEMDFVFVSLKDSLLQFIDKEPLRVYATAYMQHFGDVARAAARRLLESPDFADPIPPPPEFKEVPAIALHYVFEYRRRCAAAARSALESLEWMVYGDHSRRVSLLAAKKGRAGMVDASKSWAWLSCPMEGYNDENHLSLSDAMGDRYEFYSAPWWTKYVERVKSDVSTRPLAKIVTDASTMEPFIVEAQVCTTCAPKAWKDLTDFSQMLAAKMDEAISEVEMELPS